jgi:4-amino-4-deoxy-L-arabinose transferase-like glycosyltransferase
LFGARLLSLIGGLLQILSVVLLVRELKGRVLSQVIAAVLVTFLPFWFFHHRMALMDGWLAVWLTFSVLFLLKSLRTKSVSVSILSGLCFGAALLTKIPAVLAIPSLVLMSLYHLDSQKKLMPVVKHIAISLGIGLFMFACLKISPSFSQLFSRGGDFLFSVSDIFKGIWFTTIKNTPSYLNYFWQYATPPAFILFAISPFLKYERKRSVLLLLSFLAFCIPIALMGKVVFPRYLLPAMIFLTVAVSLTAESLMRYKNSVVKWSGVGAVMLAILFSTHFMYPQMSNPNATPFVSADRMQYLTEWSAGHGTKEIYQRIVTESKTHTVAVATEGYFGSLPDGLLLYLYSADLSNISVEGVGQPIGSIPQALIGKKDSYDRLWLVVNSHRRTFELPKESLLASYCRPYNAPCLELWDVTALIHSNDE